MVDLGLLITMEFLRILCAYFTSWEFLNTLKVYSFVCVLVHLFFWFEPRLRHYCAVLLNPPRSCECPRFAHCGNGLNIPQAESLTGVSHAANVNQERCPLPPSAAGALQNPASMSTVSHSPQPNYKITAASTMAGHAIVEADIPQVFFPGTPPSIRFDFPRKRALPKLLPCRFVIRLSSSGSEGRNRPEKFVHHHFFNIEWLEDKNFLDCVEKGMRFLNRTVNAREHVYRNSLQYRVLRQLPNLITKRRRTFSWSENMTAQYPELEAYPEEEVYAESIDKDGQWHERLPPRLTEEMRADRDSTLFLELVLSCTKYTPHSPNHCSNHNCAAEIRQILDSERVSVKTPPGAWFVSARFLDNFFTPVLISHLIEQDTALNQDDDWLRAMHESKESIQAQFVMDVNQWFIHLLASCIYAKVSLRCLYHLWRAEKLDEDIPLSDHWIPPGVDKPDYENYVRYQGNFRANRFQDPSQPQKHQVIKHGVVIPLTEDSPLDKGSFGEVRRVQIHGDYHGFTPVSFARVA